MSDAIEPVLESVTEEPTPSAPTNTPRERSEAQKLALAKAREKAMAARRANAELRQKQKAIEAAEKQQKRSEVEQKYEALQMPKEEPEASPPPEEAEEGEEEVVYEKRPKKKVKRRVVVVQESSDEEEFEIKLPKKKTKPAEHEVNPFLSNRVFSHPGRYA